MSGLANCFLRIRCLPGPRTPTSALKPDKQTKNANRGTSICKTDASLPGTAAVLGEYENCRISFVCPPCLCLSMRAVEQRRGGRDSPGSPRPLCKIVAQSTRTRQEKRLHLQFPQILALHRLHPLILKSVSHHHLVLRFLATARTSADGVSPLPRVFNASISSSHVGRWPSSTGS
jgi:hypothetical protein